MGILNNDIRTFFQVFDIQRANEAQAALNQNSAIVSTGIHEYNERTVNEIMLLAVPQGRPNALQITALDTIASQCPLSGGTAVFRARSYLSGYTGTIYNDNACNTQQYQKPGGQGPSAFSEFFMVRPNPAKGYFVVSCGKDNSSKDDQDVLLYDLNGKVVRNAVLSKGDKDVTFETAGLSPGIYFVKVLEKGRLLFSTKLAIHK